MQRAKIARRGFLIGSAAIAGGVAFGTYRLAQDPANPLLSGLGPDAATFNPWVTISAEKITLITPHADVGQGARHMQALLLAEEMDLELDQFETDFGAPSVAYFNAAMAGEGAPFPVTDRSRLAEATRSVLGVAARGIGLQATGGSTSVSDSYEKLRLAGAVARETLKRAAAQVHGVDAAALRTEAGAVLLPDGQRIPYQALAAAAARLDPVQEVALRDPASWRLIGMSTQRLDILQKSTGRQRYGIDVELDGMVHAAVRLSPRRSPVQSADLEAARAVPGVLDVLEITHGFAVVAGNTWSAMEGARAIDVTWAPASYPAEQSEHWAELARAIDEDRPDATLRDDGDVEADTRGLALEAEYRAPYVAHQPLEPLNATLRVDEDQAEVWTGTQVPRFLQAAVARVTGHDAAQVVLHNQFAGGSFGHRLELEHVVQAAEIAVQLPGQPVKLTYSREEDFAQDFPRQISLARARGEVAGGQVAMLSLDIAAPSPIASQLDRLGFPMLGPDLQIAAGAWNAPYAFESFRVRGYRAEGLAPVSSWRAVGASACGFFLEGFLDELIHAAGADPLEARLGLCAWDVARGVLEAVAEMSDWGIEMPPGRGRGVALVESFGVPVAEVVEVVNTDQGILIDKVWVAADVGQVVDPVTFENQVQGGVIWGLGHAINSEITYADGAAQQENYYDAEAMRLHQVPQIEVRGLNRNHRIRGIGEPPVPPAAPALANAIFAATGTRLREMPFNKFVDFV